MLLTWLMNDTHAHVSFIKHSVKSLKCLHGFSNCAELQRLSSFCPIDNIQRQKLGPKALPCLDYLFQVSLLCPHVIWCSRWLYSRRRLLLSRRLTVPFLDRVGCQAAKPVISGVNAPADGCCNVSFCVSATVALLVWCYSCSFG